MSANKYHIDFENDFFKNRNIQYSTSMDDVWADMELKMNEKAAGKVILFNFTKLLKYSAAAILIIGLGLLSFMRLYTTRINCPNAQHAQVQLPDGSAVTLNAKSELSYHPYWWLMQRKVDFNGEAFFKVKKGKKFIVVSEMGTTTVLGTSFNIFSRNNEDRVNCISGRVLVENKNNESTILTKNEYTIINQSNKLVKLLDVNKASSSIAWMHNEFNFTSIPLTEVYEEIERQYDITIVGKENMKGLSTFNSKKESSAEEIINMVGKPFGIRCTKISDKKFIVEQNQEQFEN
jgi:transmembrane sensor